jgi:hypothetical protein
VEGLWGKPAAACRPDAGEKGNGDHRRSDAGELAARRGEVGGGGGGGAGGEEEVPVVGETTVEAAAAEGACRRRRRAVVGEWHARESSDGTLVFSVSLGI